MLKLKNNSKVTFYIIGLVSLVLNKILFSFKDKCNYEICGLMDETWNNHSEWGKSRHIEKCWYPFSYVDASIASLDMLV